MKRPKNIRKLGERINWRHWLIAAASSLMLVVISYYHNNSPLFTGENLTCFAAAEWLRNAIHIDKNAYDSVLFINTAYDRQLTTHREDGIAVGNIDITDREKLCQLLLMLKNTNYRYIFLDIRFEQGCESDNPAVDSALFATISNMERIVVAKHQDIPNMDGVPADKMAYNDYYSTITSTNFVRYLYRKTDGITMPLYAFEELTGNTIEWKGLVYKSEGHICYNSLFLTFPPEKQGGDYTNQMGKDILLSDAPEENIKQMADGKYVIIGDLVHDLHDTYSGLHSGSKMIAAATLALFEHKHWVNPWLTAFLFILYFLMTLGIFATKRWYEYIPSLRNIRVPLLYFALSFLGYTAVLWCTSFMLGLCLRWYVTFWIPSLWFGVFSSYITYKRNAA